MTLLKIIFIILGILTFGTWVFFLRKTLDHAANSNNKKADPKNLAILVILLIVLIAIPNIYDIISNLL